MRTLLIACLLFVLINFGYLFFLGSSEKINVWEIRLYIFYFMACMFAVVFGVLRIYNAIVVNTQYAKAIKKEMVAFSIAVKKFEQSISSNLTNKIDKLGKTIIQLKDKINNRK